jgi:isopenicillin-N N-acyltransferase-like protein
MNIKHLCASGNSYEVGFQHGKAAAPDIKKNYQYYMATWLSCSGSTEVEILEKAMGFLPHICALDAELVKELEGIATGAELKLSQIVALNSRWELNYAYLPDMNYEADGGCTAFALIPETTVDGHTYVGQNWDYKPPLQGQCLLLKIDIPGRPLVTLITEAGIIGHKGVSSTGIGIGLNFIKMKRDKSSLGVPFLIKARHILELPNLDSCIRFMKNNPGPNSGNMLIASREGLAVDAECNPTGMNLLEAVEGVLVHSNHFQKLDAADEDIGCRLLPDTYSRTQQLYRHFHAYGAGNTAQTIEAGLRDHSGYPNSICRHEDETLSADRRWQTLVSFYVDLDTGRLRYNAGPPCLSDYSTTESIHSRN